MIFKKKPYHIADKPMGQAMSSPSVVAHDMVIEGHVAAAGDLHINGTIFGTVQAQSCVIDRNGFVQGEINAEEIFIRGRVIGPIYGKNISIYDGAEVEGDIFNETISIETGANIYGMISRSRHEKTASAPAISAAPPAPVTTSLFASAPLTLAQDNFDQSEHEDYRPIKVVKPR